MANRRLLLLSNSKNAGQGYLEHALPFISDFLGRDTRRVLFIPYAGVTRPFDEYEAIVMNRFQEISYAVKSIHHAKDAKEAVENAEAIAVGGGNTFHLLRGLYDNQLLEAIRARVLDGAPYIGWSAGSNVACPSIKTTNDMPIVEPPSFSALNLVPFQINPHYLDAHPEGHQGETREERILEFIEANAGVRVVGLREGSLLKVEGSRIKLLGPKSARLFLKGTEPRECSPEDSLEFLLE
jgi:dipeptidase E